MRCLNTAFASHGDGISAGAERMLAMMGHVVMRLGVRGLCCEWVVWMEAG